jgi:molybdopterin converting factor small subunit
LRVHLRLYGVFRTAAGSSNLSIELPASKTTVRNAIAQLVSDPAYRTVKSLLFDEETTDPRPNALIMISGREIGTLNGLDTEVSENDEVSLLPIAHGG